MYYSNVNDPINDKFIPEEFKECLDFMRQEFKSATEGATDVNVNDKTVAHFQAYETIEPNEIRFESHRKFYDIQFVLEGEEIIEVTSPEELTPSTDYDPINDIIFYADPKTAVTKTVLKAGDFAILGITDAHKPKLMIDQAAPVKKIVIKVPID